MVGPQLSAVPWFDSGGWARMSTRTSDLHPGDRFTRDDVTVTVLRPSEPCTDRFGRPMVRYWCSRSDTGAEGWMTYGPAAAPLVLL